MLSQEQITQQLQLLPEARLKVMDACKIIYPGKNHDAWWDLAQLMDQTKVAVDIFEYLHPEKVGIWLLIAPLHTKVSRLMHSMSTI